MDPIDNRAILSVSSSAVQLFELLSNDNKIPKLIFGFDYSPKQIGYNYLLKNALHLFSFQEFLDYFCPLHGNVMKKSVRSDMHRLLVNHVPSEYKKYVPRTHEFLRRDRILNSYNQVRWFTEKNRYNTVKNNLGRIRFFEYEIHPYNLNLSKIFVSHSFDTIYLSNIFDWLCWHNRGVVNTNSLLLVYHDIMCIMKAGGTIILNHLSTRESFISQFIQKINATTEGEIDIYKYKWAYYRILC